MNIAIGCDHRGFKLKTSIIKIVQKLNHSIIDLGCTNEDSVDYPDFASKVSQLVQSKNASLGILICASGNGMAITSNKFRNIRVAVCRSIEEVKLARAHNDANILCIGADFVPSDSIQIMIESFFNTKFEGERHLRRINKIPESN